MPLNKFIESGNALWNAMLIDNIYTPPKSIKFIHKKSINFQKPPSKSLFGYHLFYWKLKTYYWKHCTWTLAVFFFVWLVYKQCMTRWSKTLNAKIWLKIAIQTHIKCPAEWHKNQNKYSGWWVFYYKCI